MSGATEFIAASPSADACWRAVVLFGRNTASYKFALAEALLALPVNAPDIIKLEDIALPYAEAICRHLKVTPKQGTSQSSSFLKACAGFNDGSLTPDQLRESTVKLGFINVLDAFHIVNQGEVPYRFFVDQRVAEKGIQLTDELRALQGSCHVKSLPKEVEARWRLVETAWSLGLGTHLIDVDHDGENPMLLGSLATGRRIAVTPARDALCGYQKGECFYCFRTIDLGGVDHTAPDVDHFFPHSLKKLGFTSGVDAVWNLVLACRECNRGSGGKFARVPALKFLDRLETRNNYYVSSHHPLRETIMAQTGFTDSERRTFLRSAYRQAKELLIHEWAPDPLGDSSL